MDCTLSCLFYLCLQTQLAYPQMKDQTLTLTMNANVLDDRYEGCADEMENLVLTKYLKEERLKNLDFKYAWDNATRDWPEKRKSLGVLPKGFKDNHGIALMAYTNMRIPLYSSLNIAVREFETSKQDFPFKAIHFYLTTALQLLRVDCRGNSQKVYKGLTGVRFLPPTNKDKKIRLGQFSSSSVDSQVAEGFGKSSFFKLSTCFAVDLQKFSYFPKQKEMLIPVDEVFQVSQSTENENVFIMESTKKQCHYYNCFFLNGRKSQSCIYSSD